MTIDYTRHLHFQTCFAPVYSVYFPKGNAAGVHALHQTEHTVWADYGNCAFPRTDLKSALKEARLILHRTLARVVNPPIEQNPQPQAAPQVGCSADTGLTPLTGRLAL